MGVMVSPVAGGEVARALRLLLVVVDNVDKLQVRRLRLSSACGSGVSVNSGWTRVAASPVLLVKIWRAGGQLLLIVAQCSIGHHHCAAITDFFDVCLLVP